MDKAKALAEWLVTQGELEFSAFVTAARAAGLDPVVWHKAKRQGLLTTEIRDGKHYIKAVK